MTYGDCNGDLTQPTRPVLQATSPRTHFLTFVLAMALAASFVWIPKSATGSESCPDAVWEQLDPLGPPGVRDEHPFAMLTDNEGVVHLLVARKYGTGQQIIGHEVLGDDGWEAAPAPPAPSATETDRHPYVSLDDDGNIRLVWTRQYGGGTSDARIMTSLYDVVAKTWFDAQQLRNPIGWFAYPSAAAVDADSLWVFFLRGTTFRAKPMIGGIPGPEYEILNTAGESPFFRTESIRRRDGTIMAFWIASIDEWPLYIGQYTTIKDGIPAPAKLLPSPNGAFAVAVTEDSSGMLWVSYLNSLNGGRAAALIGTDDGINWTWPLRVGGYDGGQNCTWVSLTPFREKQILIAYACERFEPDGTLDRGWHEVSVRSYSREDGFCEPFELSLPQDPNGYERHVPSIAVDGRGMPVVGFGLGPQVWYTFQSIRMDHIVGITESSVQLRSYIDGVAHVLATFNDGDPLLQLRAWGRSDPREQWRLVGGVVAVSGTETEIRIQGQPSNLWVELYSPRGGRQLAKTPVVEHQLGIGERLTVRLLSSDRYEICGPGNIRDVSIYNLAGRRVAELSPDVGSAQACATWVFAGQPRGNISRGAYFVRFAYHADGATKVASTRLLIR